MFLSGVLGGSVFKTIDPDQERTPPPDPTPVTFPHHEDREKFEWVDPAALPDFQRLFSQILKPGDVGDDHIAALNVHLDLDVPLDQIVPVTPETKAVPAPLNVSGEITQPQSVGEEISKRQKDFEDRVIELSIDNDTAFRTLTRTLPAGTKGPRLAWTRKFWSGLESMSAYWDCSLDQYIDMSSVEDRGAVKRQRIDSEGGQRPSPSPGDDLSLSIVQDGTIDATDSTLESRTRYKGRRTGSGKDMPEAFRTETVRALVEAAAFPFQCSVLPPRQMPVVSFQRLNLPVRQTAAVYRVPSDRTKARQGRQEGPLIAIQARSDIDFADSEEGSVASKSRLDLLRELGGLLQIAQERRREHQTEIKPGEGKWWTTVPRWGGGAGNHEEDTADIVQLAEGSVGAVFERASASSKARKRRTPIAVWKEIKVGSGHWDPRTEYMAIGQEPNSPYDDIFMISSLNHHISILRLRTHGAYVASLQTGQYPSSPPLESDWSRPTLSRSRWYDLFDTQDRIESFVAMWNIMTYLNRPTVQAETPIEPM